MICERPWLLPCTSKKKFYKLYKSYKITYQEYINNAFELWIDQLDKDYEKKLEKNILVGNQNDQYWHLTSNLDRYYSILSTLILVTRL